MPLKSGSTQTLTLEANMLKLGRINSLTKGSPVRGQLQDVEVTYLSAIYKPF